MNDMGLNNKIPTRNDYLLEKNQPLGRLAKAGNKLLYDNNYVAIPTFKMLD